MWEPKGGNGAKRQPRGSQARGAGHLVPPRGRVRHPGAPRSWSPCGTACSTPSITAALMALTRTGSQVHLSSDIQLETGAGPNTRVSLDENAGPTSTLANPEQRPQAFT